MKLLAVSSYFDTHPGGLETMAARLASELAKTVGQVEWLATNATVEPEMEGIHTESLPAWNGLEQRFGLPLPVLTFKAIGRLDQRIGANDVVLIHDTLYTTSILALLLAKRRRKPVLIVQHLGDARFRNRLVQALARAGDRWVTRRMLKAADQVVFVSRSVADHFTSVPLKRPAPVSFIGLDTLVFHPPADGHEKAELRRANGFATDRKVALYVGRFVETKGLETLRRVASLDPTWIL